MIEKIREIVVEDFELSEVQPIEKHIKEISRIKGNVDSLNKTLEKLQSHGVRSVIFVRKDNNVIRILAEEFLNISEYGESKVKTTNSGKVGIIRFGGTKVLAHLNDEQTEELIAMRNPFNFWYSEAIATNLGEFYNVLEDLSEKSLKHHFKSKDFSSWLFLIGEEEIGKEFRKIEKQEKYEKRTRSLLRKTLLTHVEDEIKRRLNV